MRPRPLLRLSTAMRLRALSIAAAATLLATACGGAAVDEAPDAAPASVVATTEPTTTPAPATTAAATPTTEPATTPAPTTTEPAATPAPETTLAPTTTTRPPTEAEGLGDGFYPYMGNGGYDALHYDIDLDVDPAVNAISASTTIEVLATADLETFNLDLSGLEVHSVTVDGAVAAFSRYGHELAIEPADTLAAGSQFTVEVVYSGSPERIDDPGVPFFASGWTQQEDVIYTVSQPSGSMTWFPSNNHPTDKATYEIRITVPEGLTAASNGLLVDETAAEGRTTYTWRMDDPMASYLAAVYIGDFERIDHGPLYEGGPVLRDYVPSGSPPEVTDALALTADAVAFMEELLGPYPFDAYGTIVMPFALGFALENQTLSIHGNDTLIPFVIAHELAHQWLGNSVAPDDWTEIWMNEGFASYLHLMYEAEHDGTDLNENMGQIHAWLIDMEFGPPRGIEIADLFDPTVYYRGAATLHALRLHAGDETFFDMLRTHYDRSAGGTTNTAEFLALVEEMAGPDAVDLVESWLYDKAVPETL